MSQDTENFEQLRRLLALKRHEQPPPGFFNGFSRQVIARIKLGERGDDGAVIERFLWEASWLQRLWAAFETKPILAGAFAVAVCGLMITGVIYSEKTDVQPVALIPGLESGSSPVEIANVVPTMTAANHPLLAKTAAIEAASTNPMAAPQSDGPLLGGLRAQPASFRFSGGN